MKNSTLNQLNRKGCYVKQLPQWPFIKSPLASWIYLPAEYRERFFGICVAHTGPKAIKGAVFTT